MGFIKKERKKDQFENTHIPQASEAEVLLKSLLHYTCNQLTLQWFSVTSLGSMPLCNPRELERCRAVYEWLLTVRTFLQIGPFIPTAPLF